MFIDENNSNILISMVGVTQMEQQLSHENRDQFSN